MNLTGNAGKIHIITASTVQGGCLGVMTARDVRMTLKDVIAGVRSTLVKERRSGLIEYRNIREKVVVKCPW